MTKPIIPIARFVTSPAQSRDGVSLILGSAFRGQSLLVPNHIYQLDNMMGGYLFRSMGPSALSVPDHSLLTTNWDYAVNSILDISGRYIFLTRDEFNVPNILSAMDLAHKLE